MLIVYKTLNHIPKKKAFHVMIQLMKHYEFSKMFERGFPALHKHFWIFSQLLRKQYPKLYNHFEEIGIEPSMYLTQWFLTLFACSLPIRVVIRIWDMFFISGWIFVHKVALAALNSSKSKLFGSFEETLRQLKSFHNLYTNGTQIFRSALGIKVGNKIFQKLNEQHANLAAQKGHPNLLSKNPLQQHK